MLFAFDDICTMYVTSILLIALCGYNCFADPSPSSDVGTKSDHVHTPYTSSFQGFEIGDPQNCPQTAMNIAEVLPGNGWDNLRNVAMGHVVVYNYSRCKIFQDRSFLLPDNIYAVPLKESDVKTYSQLITHSSNYTSVTSDSINVGAHGNFFFGSISGSFSRDYKETKMHIAGDKSTASRVQLRYEMFAMRSEPDPELHPIFKNRLMDIASFVQNGDNASATYLAQLLVRDYGSHYVTSVTAGIYTIDSISMMVDLDFVQFYKLSMTPNY